jgi:hypothetical protein|tara:strand:+ start:243 stop:488 length:246 start_codon:yes stop_codon:yes gene_type:complete
MAELFKVVDGVSVLLNAEEVAAREAEEAAWLAATTSREATRQIEVLEKAISPRRIREAILGTDGGWLAAQEALIATERAKL